MVGWVDGRSEAILIQTFICATRTRTYTYMCEMDIYATAMYVEYVRDKRTCTDRNAHVRVRACAGPIWERGLVGGQGVALPTQNAATNRSSQIF